MGRTLPRILVTAGPTREYIDPTRFISNPSSGRMGTLIARAAQEKGCKVLLILGPTSLRPRRIKTFHVETALEMFQAVRKHFRNHDILIMAAAVSDYRPGTYTPYKIEKGSRIKKLELVPNPDILAWAARHTTRQILVGFAAETDRVLEKARAKLIQKKLDMIVANRVGRSGRGFESDKIEFSILRREGSHEPFRVWKKEKLAREIVRGLLQAWE